MAVEGFGDLESCDAEESFGRGWIARVMDGNEGCLTELEVILGLSLPSCGGFALGLGSLLFWDRYVESDFGDAFDESGSSKLWNIAKRFPWTCSSTKDRGEDVKRCGVENFPKMTHKNDECQVPKN